MLFAMLVAVACDGLDPSVLRPPTDGTATSPDPVPSIVADVPARPSESIEESGSRAADMNSIGPDASKRIYYQFIDDRGRVHFVDRLGDVPESWRSRVGFVEMDRPPPLTPADARRAWQLSANDTARILAENPGVARSNPGARGRQTSDVVLYSAEWCGYCRKAQGHLDREGVDYEVRDVDIPAVAQELRDKTGRGGVPVLDYDGQVLRGYSETGYDRAIRTIRG